MKLINIMQQINLYQIEIQEEVPFSFLQAVRVLIILMISLVVASGWLLHGNISQQKKIASLAVAKQKLSNKFVKLSRQVPEDEQIKQLTKQIQLLEKKRNSAQDVVNTMRRLQIMELQGFSKYLQALADQKIAGLQITKFIFAAGGDFIKLEGVALQPDLIPQLIQSLSSEKMFNNKLFELLQLQQDKEDKLIHFSLETAAK